MAVNIVSTTDSKEDVSKATALFLRSHLLKKNPRPLKLKKRL